MTREQSVGRLILGVFEVGLGVVLIIIDALGPLSKLLAGGWAFIGGIVLIIQALQMRTALKATCGLNEQMLTENDTFSLSCGE